MSSSARLRAFSTQGTPTAWAPRVIELKPTGQQAKPEPEVDAVAEAYAQGFADGRREGEAAERMRLGPAVRVAEEALEAMNEADGRWTDAIEENLVALSLAVARHIIDREVATDPEIVEKLVRRALDAFPVDQPVQIRVHPDDLVLIRTLRDERPSQAFGRSEANTAWVADPRVTRGGCMVEGRERIVDARIETALERIYRRLSHQQNA